MYKEAKKIEMLTEKLKKEGDVTPDEADYIFIIRCISRGYQEGYAYRLHFENNFNSHSYWINQITVPLKEWYEEVYNKVKKSETGNFITTVPGGLLCSSFKLWVGGENPEHLICRIIEDIQKKLRTQKNVCCNELIFYGSPSIEDYISRSKGNLLSPDIVSVNNGAFIITSRMGLFDRIFKDAKTVNLDCNNYKSTTFDFNIFADTARHAVMLELNVPFVYILNNKNSMTVIYPKEFEGVVNEVLSLSDKVFQNISEEYNSKENPITDNHGYYNTADKNLMADFAKAVISRLNLQKVNIKKTNAVTKDVAYLTSKAEQLNSGKDITKEESDYIYALFKFAQVAEIKAAQNDDEAEKEEMKKNSEVMFDAFAGWYKAVLSAIEKGKKGNFLYTIPTNPKFNLNKAGRYIKKCLKLLPTEPSLMIFEENDSNVPEIKDISVDVETFKSNNTKAYVFLTNRYGFYERNGIDLNKYKIIFGSNPKKNTTNLSFTDSLFYEWLEKRTEENQYQWEEVPPVAGKLEALAKNGIYPVLLDDRIAIPAKDTEKAKHILEVPDDEIEELVYRKLRGEELAVDRRIKELYDIIDKKENINEVEKAAEEILTLNETKERMDEYRGERAFAVMPEIINKLAETEKRKETLAQDDDLILFDR